MDMLCPHCWGNKIDPSSLSTCPNCKGTGATQDQQLSPHFRLSEMVYSQTAVRQGIANDPSAEVISRLTTLCNDLLEPIRSQFGALHVDSGFRSFPLNRALSGASATSVHSVGWAADIIPTSRIISLKSIMEWVLASSLPFDQVIYEGSWLHLGRYNGSGQTRRMPLMAFPTHGKMHYSLYIKTDPRVV